jgi:uncharacterized protein YeaO (DUF488 family)
VINTSRRRPALTRSRGDWSAIRKPRYYKAFFQTLGAMDIALKSILLPASLSDGLRVYVERRWPRSVAEKSAKVDLWLPEVAFTRELAQWFSAHPGYAPALRKRYFAALRDPAAETSLEKLYAASARRRKLTLLHAGKQGENSAAALLKDLMEGRGKPPSPTGPARAAAAVGVRAARRPRGRR